MERWLPVPDGPGYEVSDLGRVRGPKGGALRAARSSGGYLTVTICAGGKRRTESIHRLVLRAFIGPCPEGMQGCHNDGDRANNRQSNLRYDTCQSNILDKRAHGTMSKKLDVARVAEIVALQGKASARAIARTFGVSHTTVLEIFKGRRWA